MGSAVASAGLAELTRASGGGYHGPPELTVARAFTDSRVQTIFGGTSEIQHEIIAKQMLGL